MKRGSDVVIKAQIKALETKVCFLVQNNQDTKKDRPIDEQDPHHRPLNSGIMY